MWVSFVVMENEIIVDNEKTSDCEVLSRLRWATRRGMLELDLILSPYVEEAYLTAQEDESRGVEPKV